MSDATLQPAAKIQPPETGPALYVMPEDYRHGATGKKLAEPVAPKAVPSAPAIPKPVAPAPVEVKKSSKKKPIILIVVVLVLILAAGGGAAWWFLFKTPTVQPQEKPTRPAVTTTQTTKPTTPVETKKPEPEVTPEPTPSPFPTTVVPGTDTDSDGLTDIEEKLVYNTNAKLPDSDADGFLDGNEVFHRYNPAGTAPGTLFESGLVKAYEGILFRLYYPSVWTVSSQQEVSNVTTFVATTGEAFSVTTETISNASLTLAQWYKAQNKTEAVTTGITKNGLEILTSEKQLTSYLRLNTQTILTITYSTSIKGTIDYLQTLQMMINSIQGL